MRKIRLDRVEFLGKVSETTEGYLRGKVIASRTGVFHYEAENGDVYADLRHPEDVFASDSLTTLKSVPITMEHPPEFITAENAKEFAIGMTGDDVHAEGKYVVTNITIFDKGAIQQIKDGKRELSIGYEVELIPEKGSYDGQEYTYRQTNITHNHVSVVDRGRAGPMAAIVLDGQGAVRKFTNEIKTEKEENNMSTDIPKTLPSTVLANGETTINAKELEELRKANQILLDAKKSEMEKLQTELNEAKEKAVDYDKVKTDVMKRYSIEQKASSLGVEFEATDADKIIMERCILQSVSKDKREALKAQLGDKEDAYIQALFDQLKEHNEDAIKKQNEATAQEKSTAYDKEERRRKYMESLTVNNNKTKDFV